MESNKELLHEVLLQSMLKFPGRIAFETIETNKSITFAEFFRRIECLAGALADLGVKKGDRVSILAENCVDYIGYHYATAMLGAILHVINTRLSEQEMIWIINNAESSLMIIDETHVVHWPAFSRSCPPLRFMIGIGDVAGSKYGTADLVEAAVPLKKRPALSSKDPVLLIYTSGTTGLPKGALQTHEGSTTVDALTAEFLELTDRDVYLAFMPYFHQAGLIRTRAVMAVGGKNVVSGKKWDNARLPFYMAERKVTVTLLIPPIDTLVLETVRKEDLSLSTLRLIIGGGGLGQAYADRMKVFCERMHCISSGIYGLTECTGPVTVIKGDDCFRKPDSCGKPMPGIDLEIWDEQNRPVPIGEIGEVMVRGKTAIPGYWRNETATKELYTDDWVHTGDLGRLDEEGFLYIVDRKKDMIKTGAENVYSKEVEDVLCQHPSIADVAVIGLRDAKPGGWGEVVTAIVVNKPDVPPVSVDDLKEFCKGKIGGYKAPKIVHHVNAIPRNAIGKVLKVELRKQFSL